MASSTASVPACCASSAPGWGKSAVYFLATSLLREQGAGPALIVSPLLALMRNQIAAAEKLGIRAHTINSTNRDAWDEVRDLLETDAVDLLLISPERLNNPQFRDTMLPLFAERVGLLVVDEAHCICDWGHDFRPDYRRMPEMLERLPEGVAVLCTTATANDRVVADVAEQLQLGPRRARCRPTAGRSAARRCGWRSSSCPPRPTGSRGSRRTCRSSRAPASSTRSPSATPTRSPSGSTATASPPRPTPARSTPSGASNVEERLLRNELKAVVATSALGMGYDKPDLGFVVHYQAPGSVISYYQQVGRAGRAIERADVVLLRGREDRRIQDFFIEQAFPPKDRVDRVLEAIEDERRHHERADGRGQPRQGPDRGDAEGARRRGRGHPRGHEAGRASPAATGATTATATPTSPRCAGTSRRRWRRSAPTAAA